MRRRFRSSLAAAAVITGGALAPCAAQAATVSVTYTSTGANDYLNYESAPGEANTVVITIRGGEAGGWLVSDIGAPLTAGAGCTSIDAHTANCPQSSRIAVLNVDVDLGDQSDWASVLQACTPIDYDENSLCHPSRVDGGSGSDVVFGSDGVPSLIKGGTGDDVLSSGKAGAVINGGPGGDSLSGSAARDRFFGGTGQDSLWGHVGNDSLSGGDDEDRVFAGPGSDTISGGRGRDRLLGQSGSDAFDAKDGYRDAINGGTGRDRAGIDPDEDTTKGVERVHG